MAEDQHGSGRSTPGLEGISSVSPQSSVLGPRAPGARTEVVRFSRATRLFHWVHAIPFLFLLATGLLLFVPAVKGVHVGGHRLVPLLHVVVGIGFIAAVPLVMLLALKRRDLGDDLRAALTPEADVLDWGQWAVWTLLGASLAEPPAGKFNAGQKLSSLFWWAVTAGLMATGAVLAVNYFTKRLFSAALVEQVFPWHTLLMLISLPVLAGHLYLSLLHPTTRPSLRGILTGRVDAAWARRHHARWAEETAAIPDAEPRP